MAGKLAKKKDKNAYLFVGLGVGVITIIAAVSIYWFAQSSLQTVEIDKASGCPINNSDLSGHTVFLFDGTNELSYPQREKIRADIKNQILSLPEYHKVSLHAIYEDEKKTGTALISLCTPRQFRGDRDTKFMFGSEFFAKQLQKALASMDETVNQTLQMEEMPSSPILESLLIVQINAFEKLNLKGSATRHLIIYSDMLHHTREFSLYQLKSQNYNTFSSSTYAQKSLPPMRKIEITVNQLMHSPKKQVTPLQTFWRELLNESGGKVVAWNIIRG
jgi:hypothetical protein